MILRFADLFSGTGGIRIGFEQACGELGITTECVLSSEIDKSAKETYKKNFGETPLGDIRQITNPPDFDFLLAGFPCQPFSYAGKQRGFGETRGTLFFELERLIKEKLPQGFLLENVRGLTTHDHGRTFKTIVKRLEDLGYGVTTLLLNSSNFGVPQNRVRIYILGLINKKPKMTLVSDKGPSDSHQFKANILQKSLFATKEFKVVKDILDNKVDQKYYCSDIFVKQLEQYIGKDLNKLAGMRLIDYRNGQSIHSWQLGIKGQCSQAEIELMDAIIANRRKKSFGSMQDGKRLSLDQIKTFYKNKNLITTVKSLEKKGYLKAVNGKYNPVSGNMSFEIFKFLDPNSISITLVSSDAHKIGIVVNNKIRRITPREAARIQGYPESFIIHPNDSHAYRQFGNAVSVPVIKSVLLDYLQCNKEYLEAIQNHINTATEFSFLKRTSKTAIISALN